MAKASARAVEKRQYIRLQTPIDITYVLPRDDKIHNAVTKDISADGLGLQVYDKAMAEFDVLDLKLDIPNAANPIHAKGKVVWKKRLSLEDTAPFDVGIEFAEIEEDNKNTFLKFLCDLIYNLPQGDNL